MKLGAENKKSLYALIVLGVVAAYMVYSQLLSGPSYPTNAPRPAARVDNSSDSPEPDVSQAKSRVGRSSHKNNGEFKPQYIPKKKEDRAHVETLDPSLRLDLLEKVLTVPPAGGQRDLFTTSKTPPVVAAALPKGPEPIVKPFVGPLQPKAPPRPIEPPKPVEPPPTPIPLQYYGYVKIHPDGRRTAFFKDGDDILQGEEGSVLKGRYRIIQIGLDKVLMEDTKDKRRQPLNIDPEVTQ